MKDQLLLLPYINALENLGFTTNKVQTERLLAYLTDLSPVDNPRVAVFNPNEPQEPIKIAGKEALRAIPDVWRRTNGLDGFAGFLCDLQDQSGQIFVFMGVEEGGLDSFPDFHSRKEVTREQLRLLVERGITPVNRWGEPLF